ncbi:MAG: hypothetical protein V1725_05680 [archaeon]
MPKQLPVCKPFTQDLVMAMTKGNLVFLNQIYAGMQETPLDTFSPYLNRTDFFPFWIITRLERYLASLGRDSELLEIIKTEPIITWFKAANKFAQDIRVRGESVNLFQYFNAVGNDADFKETLASMRLYNPRTLEQRLNLVPLAHVEKLQEQLLSPPLEYISTPEFQQRTPNGIYNEKLVQLPWLPGTKKGKARAYVKIITNQLKDYPREYALPMFLTASRFS